MRSIAEVRVIERGNVIPESDLTPQARAILTRLARLHYVADQHKLALAKLAIEAAKLRGDLEALEVRP